MCVYNDQCVLLKTDNNAYELFPNYVPPPVPLCLEKWGGHDPIAPMGAPPLQLHNMDQIPTNKPCETTLMIFSGAVIVFLARICPTVTTVCLPTRWPQFFDNIKIRNLLPLRQLTTLSKPFDVALGLSVGFIVKLKHTHNFIHQSMADTKYRYKC